VDAFTKIETSKKATLIAEQILNSLRSGMYRVGDKLPSETDIAKAMGVSRPMVREVFSALRMVGILESRIGHGTFVMKMPGDIRIESEVMSVLEESESPFNVLEIRQILETGIVELAIERHTKNDLQSIEEAFEEMKLGLSHERYDDLEKGNVSFHLAIAAATQNPVIADHLSSLMRHGKGSLWQGMIIQNFSLNERRDRLEHSRNVHRKILHAIKENDRKKAISAMTEHFELMKSVLDGSLDEE